MSHPTGENAHLPPSTRPRTGAAAGLLVLSASFLLFVLELATAKALLPRFGGSPMVWTTSMLAFQILLLAGYAYAHGLAGRRSANIQAGLHIGFLLVAVAVAFWRLRAATLGGGDPAAASRGPVTDLLLTMLATMAVPFVAVSATSPLVQHWQQRLQAGGSSYWLYAVSNIGSFLGLLAYPFLIEPWLDLDRQMTLWTVLFAVTATGLGAMALWVRRVAPAQGAEDSASSTCTADERAQPLRLALWITLPAGTSALLLAATNELCQDLAVFPFLWVMPLSLYLLSFTLAFRTRPLRSPLPGAAVVTIVALSTTSASLFLPAPVHIVSIGLLVFALCLTAHRELYRLRPPARHLTSFYLWIATGSGLGAAAVALLAPALFKGYWEFQGSIILLWAAIVAAVALDREGSMRNGDSRQAAVLLATLLYLVFNRIPDEWMWSHLPEWLAGWSVAIRIGAALALAALLWPVAARRSWAHAPLWPRVLAGLVLFLTECSLVQRIRDDRATADAVARNFFGVVRVQEVLHTTSGIRVRQLTHGRINHGWQYMNPELRGLPTAYHSPSTGIGRLISLLQSSRDAIRIGVTGLGAGALAAYPRATDGIVFYEIDPHVVKLASGPAAMFGFLGNCAGTSEVVLGDARQSLQGELSRHGSRGYDALALDAFSSDAIPMHLLTREAFALYIAHLADPGGVLAVNISNRFLDIEPVLAEMASVFSLRAVLVDSLGDPPVRARSLWVLLTKDAGILDEDTIAMAARPLTTRRIAWTDTYGSPFQLLKWWTPRSRAIRFSPGGTRRPSGATAAALAPSQTPGAPED